MQEFIKKGARRVGKRSRNHKNGSDEKGE